MLGDDRMVGVARVHRPSGRQQPAEAQGHAIHATIGITVEASEDQSPLSPTNGSGATVADVGPGSPAATAGIRPGDEITAVGDQRVDDPVGLIAAVRSHAPGQAVDLKITRNGKSLTIPVTLVAQTDS